MTKCKFYAVRKGLKPGIYQTWAECQEQTHGVSGAAFKGFSTQHAADQYLKAGTALLARQRTQTHGRLRGAHSAQEQAVCATSILDRPEECNQEGNSTVVAAAHQRTVSSAATPAWLDPAKQYRLEFDGASRGNPGLAGAGAALLEDDTDSQVGSVCLNLGRMTNNQAEYFGLLAGLEACKAIGVKRVTIRGDSQLVVKQVLGKYKISNAALQCLHKRVKMVLNSFQEFKIQHVLRAHNKAADELSNRAIDTSGWDGLKDMQGQFWGHFDINPEQKPVEEEPVSKRRRLQVPASNSSQQVHND